MDARYERDLKKNHIKRDKFRDRIRVGEKYYNNDMIKALLKVMETMQEKSIITTYTSNDNYRYYPGFEFDEEGKVERIIINDKTSKATVLYWALVFFENKFMSEENTLKLVK